MSAAIILSQIERDVLEAYNVLDEEDAEGAWNPFYVDVAKAADSADRAYLIAKGLKKRGLLETNGRAGRSLLSAPSYWITEKGKEALA